MLENLRQRKGEHMGKKIDFYGNDNQIMNDAIDRILVKIHGEKKRTGAKTFLMTGCGTGVGTTTLSINLAIALSLAGWKTLLVDCDLRKGSVYKRPGNDQEKGLAEFLNGDIKKQDLSYDTNYENLDYIPNGCACKTPVRLLCSSKMEEFMKENKEEYDYIIYDLPSVNVVSDAEILFPLVDGIILVAGMNRTTKRQVREARQKACREMERYLGIIVNSVEISQYRKYRKDFDYFTEDKLHKRFSNREKTEKKGKKSTGGRK